MEKDNYCTAYEKLGAAGKNAVNHQEEYTLFDLQRVLAFAGQRSAGAGDARSLQIRKEVLE